METIPTELDELIEEAVEQPQWSTLHDYLDEYYRQLGTQGEGLKTYFDEFDKKLEGLRGIVIIGGEPGSGKTALALQIGLDTALDEKPVVIYSFEMPKVQLVTRLFQRAGKIGYRKIQSSSFNDLLQDGRFTDAQKKVNQAAQRIIIRETKDFFVKDRDGSVAPFFDFNEQIRQLNLIKEQYGCPPLILIDSLHEIPVDPKNSRELKQKIDFVMLNLRNLCDLTGATILLISHQSRSGQKEGGLQSFLGSASIEYTVDMAFTIVISDREEDRELRTAKNRYGPKPAALLAFDGKHMDFTFIDML